MCHLQKGQCFQGTDSPTTGLLAPHSHPAISGHCNNRKHRLSREGVLSTPRPLFLTAPPAQGTGRGCRLTHWCYSPSVTPRCARRTPSSRSCRLRRQGQGLFVNSIFCWELFGPPRVFLLFFYCQKSAQCKSRHMPVSAGRPCPPRLRTQRTAGVQAAACHGCFREVTKGRKETKWLHIWVIPAPLFMVRIHETGSKKCFLGVPR